MRVRKAAHGAIVFAAVIAVGLGTASPAGASPGRDVPRPEARADQAALLAAIQRDLDLSTTEAAKLVKDQAGVAKLSDTLRTKLGDDYAGAWFDRKAGKLVVAVSAAGRAGTVTSTGARSRVVKHSLRSLQSIKSELDTMAKPDRSRTAKAAATSDNAQRAKLAGVVSWSVDVQSNQLVVRVKAEERARVAAMLARHGDAVRIEETDLEVSQASDYLDGGDPFNSCSVGFNVSRDGVGYFLTAGHCGTAGTYAYQAGVVIGPFVESWFPTYDDALVRNDNPAYWVQGPWVFAYNGDPNGYYDINGYADSPVGTVVCKSGRTTGLTCGWVRAKDVTVNYVQGAVYGLTQHSACAEPGDSGGANFSWGGGYNYAEGMTSGMAFDADHGYLCLEKVPGYTESVSYYQPIAASIAYYGVTLMTA